PWNRAFAAVRAPIPVAVVLTAFGEIARHRKLTQADGFFMSPSCPDAGEHRQLTHRKCRAPAAASHQRAHSGPPRLALPAHGQEDFASRRTPDCGGARHCVVWGY